MEILRRILNTDVEIGFKSRFHVGDGSSGTLEVSHLLFADDTILFFDVKVEHLYIRFVLLCFEAVSGLKSKFFFIFYFKENVIDENHL